MGNENLNYEQQVDRWVYGAVNNGVTNFNSLLKSLPGVYPKAALDSLIRLISNGKISERIFSIDTLRKNKQNYLSSRFQSQNNNFDLPIPHPLDYDWRFSDSAIQYLFDYCLEITKPDEKITLLGTPSLFQKAKKNSFPREIVLFDNNPTIINFFSKNGFDSNSIICDIVRDEIPAIEATAIIVDPPWYEKHLSSFLWAAAKICRLNGYVLISLPPAGTRPGIEADLDRFFEWAKNLGLVLIKNEKGILPYVSPPFEINSLKAENFHNLDTEWRRGDLAVFEKKNNISVERPLIIPDLEESWLEETINGVRIKLKSYDFLEFKDPKLLTIVNNNIFPGVSRRDERRQLVEVWTSGNRVFACQGRFVLQEILRELSSGISAMAVISEKLNRKLNKEEKKIINRTKEQMLEIINIEREENYIIAFGNNQ